MQEKVLTRDDFLKMRTQLRRERVKVPELGGVVVLQELTGRDRDAWEAETIDPATGAMRMENARARLLSRCIVDEDGHRLFSAADVELLGSVSGAALDRLFDVATRLSRITGRDLAELGEASGAAPSGASGSSSRVS